ncbi:Bcr/CflA family drug resistance efflux transporter [Morganella morganii]|uniref:Bcr/CflA family efflux transporter n=1 Tax=Morganella morganii TaxID=582 RepID=A0A433ZWS5_MORMO|nr:multidrug effflux MFS transporter [Morganella morganii]RUT66549.1 Bcr/CflA family drug resistance efflux transporter [Morganella morganii]
MSQSTLGMKLAASLALITVLGPAGIDMYLPSLPDMAEDLDTSYARVQLSLTVFLLAMGAGQLLFGPVTDALGRRRPLLAGIVVFILASGWAGSTTSIGMFLYARFFQGLAASLTLVVAISTVRDVSAGTRAAQLFALLMTIEALAPVLAPAIGGYVDTLAGWRAVMLVLAALGVLALVNSFFNLPETLPLSKRSSLRPADIIRTYIHIAGNGQFLLATLALSSAFFFLFAYVGGSALIYQSYYGLAPDTFGLVFGGTGVAILLGALATSRWVACLGVPALAVRGVLLMVVGAFIAFVAAWFNTSFPAVVAGMFIAMFGLGIAESTLMSMAMSSQNSSLGTVAALLGGFQMVISSAATPLAGIFAEQGTREWLMTLVIISLCALLLTITGARRVPHDGTLNRI